MKYRRLGKSDLEPSVISLGCMSLGTDHRANERMLHSAVDLGINYFDTADLYDSGANEESIGKALKGKRDKLIIATKVGNQLSADGKSWDWNPSKRYIKESVHHSLKRLQTDYIDLYQLHGGTLDDPIEETIEAFEELKQEGHIRYYGISSIRPNTIREWIKRSDLVSIMTQYSLLDRRPEEWTLKQLEQHNVGVIVRGAVAKGFLISKEPMGILGHAEEQIKTFQEKLAAWSTPESSPAHLALKFALSHPAVTSIAVGASSQQQLEENVAAGVNPELPEDLLENLKALTPALTYELHR